MATGSLLNEAQRRRLLSHARHADELLSEVEAILNASESKSIFPKYVSDISLAQAKLVRNHIARFRDQLARVMDGLGIVDSGPAFGSIHSIRTTLAFVRITVQEMAPHYLRGYGEVPEKLVPQLQGLCVELEGLVERLDNLLAQGSTADLQARLERLQKTAGGVGLLQLLDRIITDRGLVELRPRLSMIAERLESHRYEIGVFGRVSSGKSSLLNRILQTAVLPVGVNPITAVPTRLIYGREALLTVNFADRRQERLPIERLPEFVSEVHNPSNIKGVVRLVVEVPSERLRSGLEVVDTPGLGSLATSGAAETLAYLPQCDLGLVLISAGIPLNDEDLATIRLLYEAAIPVKVLLSKADLLDPSDLESALTYTARQIRTQMGVEIDVHPVSSVPSHAVLLERWFADQLAPLYEKHQELTQESIRRKTGALREAVELLLRAKLSKTETARAPSREELLALESDLRGAAGKLEDAREFCLRASDEIRRLTPFALDQAANALLQAWTSAAAKGADPGAIVAKAIASTAGAAVQVHTHLQDLARSLTAALQRAAGALASQHGPEEAELLRPLREMPRFDPPSLRWSFHRPWLLYPRALARRRIYGDLRSTLEQPLSEAFSTYGRLVEHWVRRVLAELQSAFDSSADAYRAQLARLIGQGTVTAEERQAILDDLASLVETGGAERKHRRARRDGDHPDLGGRAADGRPRLSTGNGDRPAWRPGRNVRR
jgi:GTP-binding protein EngB required for normal cell division